MNYVLTPDDRLDEVRKSIGVNLSPADRALARARPADAGAPLPLGAPVANSPVPGLYESVHPQPLLNDPVGAPVAPSRYTLTQTTPVRSDEEIAASRAGAAAAYDSNRAARAAMPSPMALPPVASLPRAEDILNQPRGVTGYKPGGTELAGSESDYLPGGTQLREQPRPDLQPFFGSGHRNVGDPSRALLDRARFDSEQQMREFSQAKDLFTLQHTADEARHKSIAETAAQNYFSSSEDAAIGLAARSGASPESLFHMAQLADQRKRAATRAQVGFGNAEDAAKSIPEGRAGQVTQTADGRYIVQYQTGAAPRGESELDKLMRGRDAAKNPEDRAQYERAINNFHGAKEERALTLNEFMNSPGLSGKFGDDYGAYREAYTSQLAKVKTPKAAAADTGAANGAGAPQLPTFHASFEGKTVHGPDGKLYTIKNGVPVPQ